MSNFQVKKIALKVRIWPSSFDQVRATVARTAPGAEYAKQQVEICTASFV